MSSRPIATNDSFVFQAGEAVAGNLLANDSDPDGDPLFLRFFDGVRVDAKGPGPQVTEIPGDYGTFLVRPDGSFTYALRPDVVLAPGESVTETLTAKISDGKGNTDISRFSMTIEGAPAPRPQIVNLSEGSSSQSFYSDISGDGTRVVFDTADALTPQPSNLYGDVYLYDRLSDSLDNVTTEGDYYSSGASISDDGALIAFSSVASNLVPGDTELSTDVFLHDGGTDSFIWVSAGGNGASTGAVLSGDGSTLMFRSGASNLVPGDDLKDDVFLFDVAMRSLSNITLGRSTFDFGMALSGDGSVLVLQSTTDLGTEPFHIFLYSVADATYTDLTTGANGSSSAGPQAISGDGGRVVFSSRASNLTPGDTNGVEDIFLYDTATGDLVNITAGADGGSGWSGLSADGSTIAFASSATNLVAGDTNGFDDIFLYDIESGVFTNITAGANAGSYAPRVSTDGHAVSFASDADNLSPNDVNGTTDVFLYTLI